jgi:hypothetical protein
VCPHQTSRNFCFTAVGFEPANIFPTTNFPCVNGTHLMIFCSYFMLNYTIPSHVCDVLKWNDVFPLPSLPCVYHVFMTLIALLYKMKHEQRGFHKLLNFSKVALSFTRRELSSCSNPLLSACGNAQTSMKIDRRSLIRHVISHVHYWSNICSQYK